MIPFEFHWQDLPICMFFLLKLSHCSLFMFLDSNDKCSHFYIFFIVYYYYNYLFFLLKPCDQPKSDIYQQSEIEIFAPRLFWFFLSHFWFLELHSCLHQAWTASFIFHLQISHLLFITHHVSTFWIRIRKSHIGSQTNLSKSNMFPTKLVISW